MVPGSGVRSERKKNDTDRQLQTQNTKSEMGLCHLSVPHPRSRQERVISALLKVGGTLAHPSRHGCVQLVCRPHKRLRCDMQLRWQPNETSATAFHTRCQARSLYSLEGSLCYKLSTFGNSCQSCWPCMLIHTLSSSSCSNTMQQEAPLALSSSEPASPLPSCFVT